MIELLQSYWARLQEGQLPSLGYWNYFFLAFFIIIQGPIATLLGGAAAAAGYLRPGLVFLAGAAGNLAADVVWYSVGHAGKIEWIQRNGHRFGVRRDYLDRLEAGMQQHAIKVLLLAKLSAGFAVPALIAAGLTRIRWRRWFPTVLLGETLWTGTLVLLGFYATAAIREVEAGARYLLLFFSVVLVLAIVWYLPRAAKQKSKLP